MSFPGRFFRISLFSAAVLLAGICAFPAERKFLLDAAPSSADGDSGVAEVGLEFDWGWISGGSGFDYSHGVARLACLLSDSAYTDVLSSPDSNLLRENYRRLGVADGAMEFNYDVDYSNSIWGNDQCASSFAFVEAGESGGKKVSIVFAVLRGTPFNSNEWLSNLNINDAGETQNEIHKGFALAASVAHTQLISFMLRHRIDPTESRILITGHSRGAAVANLLSVLLLEDNFFKDGAIFTYTFASPNTTSDPLAHDGKYGFIWNIVNPEDIVSTVPLNRGGWHFTKYGRTRAFVSKASVGAKAFDSIYFPRINGIYSRISGRSYAPFTTGPLVPVLVTRIFESLASDVEKYYSGFLKLHSRFSSLMKRIFPDNDSPGSDESPEDAEKGGIGSWILAWLNRRTGGGVDYLKLAFTDMHTDNVYLSFMLSLGEDEVFSELAYSAAVVRGTEELAVFDGGGNVMARVMNGRIVYEDTKLPVVVVPVGRKTVLVGCPVSESYKVRVTDETLFPTPCPVAVEYFDAAGVYLENSGKQYLYPRTGRMYEFDMGKKRIEMFARGETGVARSRMDSGGAKRAVGAARLRPQLSFNVVPEIYSDTNLTLGGGVHAGTQILFGSLMTSQGLTKFGKAFELSPGIGTQTSVFMNIKFENEVFARCLWLENGGDGRDFSLVPSFRSSLSMKMIGRLTLFSAGVFDFRIDGFNADAFGGDVRERNISTFRISDKVRVAPSIQFGIRF